MAYYVETVSSSGGRHVNLYSGITSEKLSEIMDAYFSSSGYTKKSNGLNSTTYTKGSRFMRLLFGAFSKYFKFIVALRPIDESTIELSVSKDSSGMSGGVIGVKQIKKEFDKIKSVLGSI
jgi:hypothetical protein